MVFDTQKALKSYNKEYLEPLGFFMVPLKGTLNPKPSGFVLTGLGFSHSWVIVPLWIPYSIP